MITTKTILEMLTLKEFQKMQEKQLEKILKEPIKPNEKTVKDL